MYQVGFFKFRCCDDCSLNDPISLSGNDAMEGLTSGARGVEYVGESMSGGDLGISGRVTYQWISIRMTERNDGPDIADESLRMGR